MNARSFVLTSISLVASLLTSSCAHDPVDAATPKKCHGSPCRLEVTVNSCDDITVDPPAMETDHAVNLRWKIVTYGKKFAANGIEFSDPQFVPKPSPKRNQFRVQDNKTSTGDFHYKVNIEGCEPVDPYIRNT